MKPGVDDEGNLRENSFRLHLSIYLTFSFFFLAIDVLDDSGTWWFFWPMLGWGVGLVAHAFVAYGADAPFVLIDMLRPWAARLASPPRPTPLGHQPRGEAKVTAPNRIAPLVNRGERLVDAMRAEARRIPKADVRAQALDICASADRILGVLAESSEEQLARDFLDRYLAPAEAIVSRYARLSSRNVAAAEETLGRVEAEDLPLLDRKFEALYDRLHRGDLIDLEVARELLALDLASPVPRGSSRRPASRSDGTL